MPELPEVETIARGLAKRVTGDAIESVWIGEKPEPLKSPAKRIVAALSDARIAGVRRVGKHIVFDLAKIARPKVAGVSRQSRGRGRPRHAGKAMRGQDDRATAGDTHPTKPRAGLSGAPRTPAVQRQFIVHLGMTGKLLVVPAEAEVERHTHAIVRLASGRELRFVDPRRFGRLSVAERFDGTGSEPLDIGFELFAGLFRGRRTPIKNALLNQKLLRGVGNIYADESLFRAGLRPRRRAARLTRDDLRRLYNALQRVLNEAIAAGGSSVSDYVDADGDPGSFQFEHRVYGREGEPCMVCKSPIKRVVLAGRSAHYCARCQR